MFKVWAYRHTSDGNFRVKVWFDDRDLDYAYESDFCYDIIGPAEGHTYNEAVLELFKNQPGTNIVELLKETIGKEL